MRISDGSSDVCSADLPCVATTLPSLTPTMTPQPVPQKRQGALDQAICSEPMPPLSGWAAAGPMPAAAAATAAACSFRTSRLVFVIDRKIVVEGKSGSVRLDVGGLRVIKKKKQH